MEQYGVWRQQQGLANSKSVEPLLCAFKKKLPKAMPKHRKFVDPGSPMFNEVMRNVPILILRSHAYVSKAVRAESLGNMTGSASTMDPEEREKAEQKEKQAAEADGLNQSEAASPEKLQAEDRVRLLGALKKRKFYKQTEDQELMWFPHDNSPEFLKELCHEAKRPRWVFFGTPAGGAGILGCLEMGCSVVALAYDEHHRMHLHQALLMRAVESMATGESSVFKEYSLQERCERLKLTATSPPDSKSKAEEKPESKKRKQEGGEAEEQEKKANKKPKAKSKSKDKPSDKPAAQRKKTGSKKKDEDAEGEEGEEDENEEGSEEEEETQ